MSFLVGKFLNPSSWWSFQGFLCVICVGLTRVPGFKILCKWNDTGTYEMKIDAHSTCMHRGLAYWIWAFFAVMPCVTKSRAFCLGPTLPPNEPHDFLCEMAPYIEICYAASEAGRGDPSPKVRAFCNGGWPDVRQSLSIDCLPILNKPHPYSQKTKEQ